MRGGCRFVFFGKGFLAQMGRIRQEIDAILKEDEYVVKHDHNIQWKNSAGLTLLAATGFLVMSFLNVYQRSYVMLCTTAFCSLILYLGYLSARKEQDLHRILGLLLPIITLTFTYYVIIGGNDGFAALWLIIVPLMAMLMTSLRYGFLMSMYFFVFLVLTFIGPFGGWLQYDYNATFLLRFPFLYSISFCLAVYTAVQDRRYRYNLIKRGEELHKLSTVDMMTGLLNRNSFRIFEADFTPENFRSLAVIYIDVNGLHEMNNLRGHEAGDKMLRQIAAECVACFPADRIYRVGGDEFIIVCADRDEAEICRAEKELADHIAADGYSVSFGLKTRTSNFDLQEMVKEADGKMLRNKAEYYSENPHDRCCGHIRL